VTAKNDFTHQFTQFSKQKYKKLMSLTFNNKNILKFTEKIVLWLGD